MMPWRDAEGITCHSLATNTTNTTAAANFGDLSRIDSFWVLRRMNLPEPARDDDAVDDGSIKVMPEACATAGNATEYCCVCGGGTEHSTQMNAAFALHVPAAFLVIIFMQYLY